MLISISLVGCASDPYAYRSEVMELRARVKALESHELKYDDRVFAVEQKSKLTHQYANDIEAKLNETRAEIESNKEQSITTAAQVYMNTRMQTLDPEISLAHAPTAVSTGDSPAPLAPQNLQASPPTSAVGKVTESVTGVVKTAVDAAGEVVGKHLGGSK